LRLNLLPICAHTWNGSPGIGAYETFILWMAWSLTSLFRIILPI